MDLPHNVDENKESALSRDTDTRQVQINVAQYAQFETIKQRYCAYIGLSVAKHRLLF